MGETIEIGARTKIIFFDGVCNLCNSTVNYIIDHDNGKQFAFASLQSDFSKELLGSHGLDTDKLESIVLKKGDKIYKKSSAVLEIAKNLGGFWPLLYVFKIVPPFIRDFFYGIIARYRYSWFGKRESCRMPTDDLKERFLDSYNLS